MNGYQLGSNNVPGWPDTVPALPAGVPFLVLGNPAMIAEAKNINRHIAGIHRLVVPSETQDAWLRAPDEATMRGHAAWFVSANVAAILPYAWAISAVCELNEYISNADITPAQQAWEQAQGITPTAHDAHHYNQRLLWLRLVYEEWDRAKLQHPAINHIKLIGVNASVGVSIPVQYAAIVDRHDGWLGHHPYTAITNGQIRHDDGQYYSGRWRSNDTYFRSQGIRPVWIGTESGPIGTNERGEADAHAGWRADWVLGGNFDRCLDVLRYNRNMIQTWNAGHGNRHRGNSVFISAPQSGWESFVIDKAQMVRMATEASAPVPALGGTAPPPPPPIDTTEHIGVDVSHWQGEIDWHLTRERGAVFAIAKVSEGETWIDTRAGENIDGMLDAGLLPGLYHFWRDNNVDGTLADPVAQAEHFASLVPDGFVPVIDLEDTNARANPGPRVLAFLQEVERLLGVKPVIYTGAWWWDYWIGPVDWAQQYPLWVANYTTAARPRLPVAWEWWAIWQYTSSGPGYQYGASSARIDLNRFVGNIQAWWGQHVTGGSAPPPEPPPDSNLWRVTASDYLNLRDSPNGKDVGNTYPGNVLLATGLADGPWREFVVWAHTDYMEQV